MGKYDPLARYLQRQRARTATCELTFVEIERMIGALLPKGANRPEWWAGPSPPGVSAVQRAAWEQAGFEAALAPREERVRFCRRN